MMPAMSNRAFRLCVVALATLSASAAATRAHAATLPAHAEVRAGRSIEPGAFRQLVATRYQVEFKKVVAADIDRDGDIDVLATTDRTFTIWLNDGAGHLTSQRATPRPAVVERPWSNVFQEQDGRPDPPLNADPPTTAMLVERAHAPPVAAVGSAVRRHRSGTAFAFMRCTA